MNSSWVSCISLSSNGLDWNRVSYVLQSVDSAWLPVTAAAQWNSTLYLNASTGIDSWITYVRWGKTCVWRYSVKIDKCIWKIDMKWAFELQCILLLRIQCVSILDWTYLIHKVAAQKTNIIMRIVAIIRPNGSVPLANFTSKIN